MKVNITKNSGIYKAGSVAEVSDARAKYLKNIGVASDGEPAIEKVEKKKVTEKVVKKPVVKKKKAGPGKK